jgi:glycosyltransferase involved in cell wall biosynthesis
MADPTTSGPSVLIAMLTYRRPDDLDAALPAILGHLDAARAEAQLLVVDNDPEASAMPLAARHDTAPVRFVHEPTPGIAAARNRALDESGDADLLVFIDDDERPEPGWLDHLVDTWSATRPAAVVGRVTSTFPVEPDPWIAAGGFFRRRRLPTGTPVDVAATNNLLLDLAQVRAAGVRFDIAFGASGGSDTLFTRQLHQRGGRLVWCDEAVVVDVVPMSRLNRDWVLRRALRTGNSWSRTSIALEPVAWRRLLRRLQLTAAGVARMGAGLARLGWGSLTRSLAHRANGARTLARGLGMTGGAWGYTYVEYRRKATST